MFGNLGIPHEFVLFFYSALASSFGRDDSELDIPRNDDCDAYPVIEILSTYMSMTYTSYS